MIEGGTDRGRGRQGEGQMIGGGAEDRGRGRG